MERNESGYFMLAMDRHTPKSVEDHLNLDSLRSSAEDCDIALYCGLPLLSSRKHGKSYVHELRCLNHPVLTLSVIAVTSVSGSQPMSHR